MNTPERRMLTIRIVRLEQLLREACDTLDHASQWGDHRVFVAKARAALEPTCMACGGAPCVCEKGVES